MQAPLTEHCDHSMAHAAATQYSRQVHSVKARITGLAAPSWTAAAGPGMHALAEVEPLMPMEPASGRSGPQTPGPAHECGSAQTFEA